MSTASHSAGSAGGQSRSRGGGDLAAAGGVAGLTLASRALGFARWLVQASTVGAGTVAGAYATANQVPNVLYEVVVGGALAATVVPLLSAAARAGRREDAGRIASGLLGLVLAVLVPAGLVLALLADPVASLFPVSQGADPALQHGLVASFLRMFALQVPLYGVGVVLTGVLQAHGRFTWPALTPLASSLVVMAAYAVYGRMSAGAEEPSAAALRVLGWGTTLGVAALSLPLVWPARRLGLRIRPVLRLERSVATRALRLGGAGLWTLLAQQASVLAVLVLARVGGRAGTVAVYQYAQAVYVLPYAVLAVPVATVLFPRLSAAFAADAAAADDADAGGGARGLAATSTALVGAVAVAGAGALVAVSGGAERLFGLLTDVTGMGAALVAMAPGLVGYALIYQVTRVLFAADRARGAALATAAGWLAVVAFSALAVRLLAPAGGDGAAALLALGLGQSAGMAVAGAGLLAVLAASLGRGVLVPVARAAGVAVPVAAVGGVAVRAAARTAGGAGPELTCSLLGALAVAGLALAAVFATDRSLLRALRGTGPRPRAGQDPPPRRPAGAREGR
ncbi:lipid II flippase MurJ [uncultured Actinomyces sp.]|uniref:murein biosynthesis integral membrane protein MurJ n=1 Tax=uncultured Actinomyces sp. TaxID=249061 RepID=UPI00288A473A|nr:lipid II flippase MurJ [uncultured Actinomyces sp.]